jgi:murein endopeptidase
VESRPDGGPFTKSRSHQIELYMQIASNENKTKFNHKRKETIEALKLFKAS